MIGNGKRHCARQGAAHSVHLCYLKGHNHKTLFSAVWFWRATAKLSSIAWKFWPDRFLPASVRAIVTWSLE
ncbi:MAG: hypothetical protein COB90_01855 [Hyphomicrobiales bacterium]|nr:MAG: hypothetical protein COB90_01855 [Hyphomicrobiales bacterium]